MGERKRTEKKTLQLDPAIVALGQDAVLLADKISKLGGTLMITDNEITYSVSEDRLKEAAQAVAEFCECGKPGQILIPAGDDFEGAELECWDCVDHRTLPE